MSRRLRAAALAVPLLAACGGTEPAAPPEDQALARDRRLARLSFAQQRPEQAAALYAQALDRAHERDDLEAVSVLGYEAALAQLRAGDAATALATAQAVRAEVVRRGAAPRPELLLVEAVTRYRTGDAAGVVELSEAIMDSSVADDDTRARATFVRGLVAADAGDASGLANAARRLGGGEGQVAADRDELEGRLAMLRGDRAQARVRLLGAADLRRDQLDYRGMARALALAGEAGAAEGRAAEAADLYLRAGRSAQLAGDRMEAGRWLSAARQQGEIGGAPDVAAEADARLAQLATSIR